MIIDAGQNCGRLGDVLIWVVNSTTLVTPVNSNDGVTASHTSALTRVSRRHLGCLHKGTGRARCRRHRPHLLLLHVPLLYGVELGPKFSTADALTGVLSQSTCQHLLHSLANLRLVRNGEASICMFQHHVGVKWWLEEQQCVQEAAKGEDINFLIDRKARKEVDLLWCLVPSSSLPSDFVLNFLPILKEKYEFNYQKSRTYHCSDIRLCCGRTTAEIAKFPLVVDTKDDVLRLQVSMCDRRLPCMHV